jgi:hypothetical protein
MNHALCTDCKNFFSAFGGTPRYAKAVRHLGPMKKSGICKFIAGSGRSPPDDL